MFNGHFFKFHLVADHFLMLSGKFWRFYVFQSRMIIQINFGLKKHTELFYHSNGSVQRYSFIPVTFYSFVFNVILGFSYICTVSINFINLICENDVIRGTKSNI